MERGAWHATAHRVTKSWTGLKQLSKQINSGICLFTLLQSGRFGLELWNKECVRFSVAFPRFFPREKPISYSPEKSLFYTEWYLNEWFSIPMQINTIFGVYIKFMGPFYFEWEKKLLWKQRGDLGDSQKLLHHICLHFLRHMDICLFQIKNTERRSAPCLKTEKDKMSTYVKQLKEIKHVLNHYYKQRRHLPLITSQRLKKKKSYQK